MVLSTVVGLNGHRGFAGFHSLVLWFFASTFYYVQYSPWSNPEVAKGDKKRTYVRYLVNVLKGGFTARILVSWVCWMLGETKNILRIFLLRRWSQLLNVARDQGDDREELSHS